MTIPAKPIVMSLPTLPMPQMAHDQPRPLMIGPRLRVLSELGTGASGVVYRALRSPLPGHEVAVKVLHRVDEHDAEHRARFRQECLILSHIKSAWVPKLHDCGTTPDGQPFLVSELIRGQHIDDYAQHGGAVGAEARLAAQLARGIADLHAMGFVHRDIKPRNLLVMDNGEGPEVRLIDFGLARSLSTAAETGLTQAGVVCGTPAYMAPEQLMDSHVGPASDVFAFGCVVYELYSGVRPFLVSPDVQGVISRMGEIGPGLCERGVRVSWTVDRLLKRCMHPMPEARPEIAEIISVFERLARNAFLVA